ncbi:MAG: hypothetical protein H8D82_00555 [Euryarchaeota archaeon]|nr:hypothetical protein [Euryarchaeota archaeon]
MPHDVSISIGEGADDHIHSEPNLLIDPIRLRAGLVPAEIMPQATLVESLDIRLIIADGDFDGLVAAAALRHAWPEADVIFSHPAEIRSGFRDDKINKHTALCDLPFHPNCGLYIDHHATNRPNLEQEKEFEDGGGHIHWRDADSAARVAYDLFSPIFDLSNLEPIMDPVDRLDGGRISVEEFLSDEPVIWLSRTVTSSDQEYTLSLLESLVAGKPVSEIVKEEIVANRIAEMRLQMSGIRGVLATNSYLVDRLAVCELQETGLRTNGYLVTAHYGEDCDACLIIHGSKDGEFGKVGDHPLSASFYSNSFLHTQGGVFDLSSLATKFDPDGGGHRNACGCRIMPLDAGENVESREVTTEDIERNLKSWLNEWKHR